jgi:hypothetical protein
MSHRARGVPTVRSYIAGSCNCVDLYQSFRMPRLSSPRSCRLKKICPPSSDIFKGGMPSRPSIGHGRAGFSFSYVMPRGSTASFVVLLYVLIVVVLLPHVTKIPSVRLQYPPPRPTHQHAHRLSLLPRYSRFYPHTTHTKRVACNQGEVDLCDASVEPCRCWSHHRRLHPARTARCSTRAPRHTRITESRRLVRPTGACAIDGTFAFSYFVESWQH